MPRDAAVKRWCFTFNNYTDDNYLSLAALLKKECEYYIIGKEKAPTTGTEHLQGFCVFRKRQRLSSFKVKYDTKIHWEPTKKGVKENIKYCSKSKDFITHGIEPSGSGPSSKSDIPKSREVIARTFEDCIEKEGRHGITKFKESHPGTWYFHGPTLLNAWMLGHVEVKRPNIEVVWFVGPPGSGKSALASHILPRAYMKDSCTKWWHGYMFEKSCIIDNLAPNHIDINHLLNWFDRYRNKVETKGGMLPLHVEQFIITSNFYPHEVYVNNPQISVLERRLDLVKQFSLSDLKNILIQLQTE